MILKFTCEYNGKEFCGFQRQKNSRTVQQVLEDALSRYFGEQVKIAGSGRTDSGVHAKGQVCSFQISNTSSRAALVPPLYSGRTSLFKICASVNAFLPLDVSVRDFEIMPDNFHAQFSAKAKTYVYRCYVSQYRSALRQDTHMQLFRPPNLEEMRSRAAEFIGTRSFKDFCAETSDSKGFIRTIYEFDVKVFDDEVHFIIRGDGFMRKMVRIMCGAVLGLNKTLPAHGLVLESVEY